MQRKTHLSMNITDNATKTQNTRNVEILFKSSIGVHFCLNLHKY